MAFFIGVDVGTGSVRAGLFDDCGHLVSSSQREIRTWRPRPHFAQQSSTDIWDAVCISVRSTVQKAGIANDQILGIGFDATCSLVAADDFGQPVSICPDGRPEQDIILWADHRAIGDADRINQTGHERLSASGGTISPEMQIPKLCWIKSHLPESWQKTAHFFDLPDWLTWRATGDLTRSLCSTVCKWTYKGEAGSTGQGWDKSFFDIVGLDELAYDTFKRIGRDFASPGKPLGTLTENAAECLGLTQKTCVAASMIDAHAGALGTLGVSIPVALQERMALIAGTSACHITLSEKPAHVPGIWGPYFGAVLPGLWASEAGQSMAGAAIDTILERHSAHTIATAKAAEHGTDVYSYFEQALKELAGESSIAFLGEERHILPDFNGNRSPLADPTRLGVTLGQGPISHVQDLATDYLACVQSLAYGTRHILDQLANHQIMPEAIIVSGGLARNNLYCQTHADATGCLVAIPEQQEPVLLGSAMLAAVGAGWFSNLPEAMEAMSGSAQLLYPDQRSTGFHDRKYRVFRQMHDDFAAYRAIMSS